MRAIVPLLLCVTFAAEDPFKPFAERLEAYMNLRKTAAENVPKLKKEASPEEIRRHEQVLADSIRGVRREAKPGDVLGPEIKPVLRSILKEKLAGPKGRDARASIREGNPKYENTPGEVDPRVKVNATYPTNAPLSTVPASLLARLPRLPKELEYRFVGRTLILRDREANIVVDYLKEAVPAL